MYVTGFLQNNQQSTKFRVDDDYIIQILRFAGWPQKVSHCQESSLNRIKNRQQRG